MLILLFAFVLGCQAKEEASEPATETSTVFRQWTSTTGTVLNLAGGHFGQNAAIIVSNGTSCQCTIAVHGFEDNGDAEIRLCTLDGFATDPDCNALHANYTYELIGSYLELCPIGGGSCSLFE